MTVIIKYPYSPMEALLLQIMQQQKKAIDSNSLSDMFWSNRKEPRPYHARGSVLVIMRSLMAKIIHNKEPFHIVKTDRRGPHPINYQLIKKELKKANRSDIRAMSHNGGPPR